MVLLLFLLGLLGGAALYGVIGGSVTPPGPTISMPDETTPPLRVYDERQIPIHILLVGTSLTLRGDWPDMLEAELAACSERPVKVSRLARAGASIRWGLPTLEKYLADPAKPRPDIVVAEFSINDASLWHGLPLPLSRSRTLALIGALHTKAVIPFLATMNPGWGLNAFERPGQDRYQALYRDLARETGAGLIDTVPDWEALPVSERQKLVPDDLHPTEAGMDQVMVPAFLEALSALVCAD